MNYTAKEFYQLLRNNNLILSIFGNKYITQINIDSIYSLLNNQLTDDKKLKIIQLIQEIGFEEVIRNTGVYETNKSLEMLDRENEYIAIN
ncbi:hypothetical protein ACFX5K_06165 [Rickettsiales bacterium LUAb2]